MFGNRNIGEKLAWLLFVFTLLITIVLSATYYFQFDQALKERVMLQLSSVKQLKKVKIQRELEDHLSTFEKIQVDDETNNDPHFNLTVWVEQLPETLSGFQIPKTLHPSSKPTFVDLTLQRDDREITVLIVGNQDGKIKMSIVKMPEIQEILLERTGLGETGESYLVNDAYQLLTKSRFDSLGWNSVKVKTQGVVKAFDGEAGTDVFEDYRAIKVIGAFEKIDFAGINWVLLSEINYDEAMAPLRQVRNNLIWILSILVTIIMIVSYSLSRVLVKPILVMEDHLIRLSKGDLSNYIPANSRKDEFGRMFEALQKLIDVLGNTVVFAGQIGAGNFDAEYTLLGHDDKLGQALLDMKKQLLEFKTNETRLLKENQRSIIEGQENERSRLSRELHDGLGPLLTTLRMQVQGTGIPVEVKNNLLKQLDYTIAEIRQMSNNLMPSVLEDFGAGEAINNLVNQINQSTNINIKFKNDTPTESKASKNIQIALYRIVQEGINNALKHSACDEIRISLSEFEDYIGLFISDNGHGFDVNQVNQGSGLRNIRERVNLVNGTIQIDSDSEGTKIDIEIPIP